MDDPSERRLPIRKTALALIGELGSESNAHGVARIVRSRDSRRKVVWSLLVLFGVGAAISQLSSLVHKYLQYQVVEVSEIQDSLPVEFPSVTVCNIEPISWRKLRELLNNTVTYRSNNNDTDDSYSSNGTSDVRSWLDFLETFSFGEQEARLRSIRAFHENVGEDALYVRHSLNESLLHCRFNKQRCSTANFTTSFDGNYYSCFTFNTQPSEPENRLIVHSTGPEHGLSVIMFLDNNEPPLGTYGVYTLDTNILHSAGARVLVHAPNTLPIPVDHGQDVAPGFSTSVSIKPFLHARLPQPYGNCSDSSLRGLTNFTSTFSTCIAVCKQELIVRECGCRSSVLPQIPRLMHVQYCGHVPNWRHMLQHKETYNRTLHLPALHCEAHVLERLKNDRGYETNCGCTHPCGELSYHMSTSMSYWPTELYQFDALTQMYGDSIKDSPLHRAYALHKINIDAGEKLMNELQQQGQHHGENTTSTTEASVGADEKNGARSGGGGGGQDNVGSDGNTASASGGFSNATDSNNSSSSSNFTNSQEGAHQQQPSLEYNRQQLDNLREASTDIRQNLLRLNVYLEDLSVVKYKQMPAYGMEDLFADIGGTLGLWMGVSVLTIMELLELIFRLSYLFLRAEWTPGGPSLDDGQQKNSNRRDSYDGDRDIRARSRSPFEDHNHHNDHHHYHHHNNHNRPSHNHDDDHEMHPYCNDHEGHGGYSYRTEADLNRHLDVDHGLFETSGHSGVASSNSVAPMQRAEYSGRTKYWRLKRGKSKR